MCLCMKWRDTVHGCMMCTQNVCRDGNSFTWHQPCNNQTALQVHHFGGYWRVKIQTDIRYNYIRIFTIHLNLFRGRGKGVKRLQTYIRSISQFAIHLKLFIIKLIINQLIMSNINQTWYIYVCMFAGDNPLRTIVRFLAPCVAVSGMYTISLARLCFPVCTIVLSSCRLPPR